MAGITSECEQMIVDLKNMDSNMGIWNTYGSELAGNFGMIPCGKPTVWGQKMCELHKVERRAGKDRRKNRESNAV